MSDQRESYGPVTPKATYSPWRGDAEFNQVYDAIRSNTLVDIYRCYELWTLIGQTAHLLGDIIEIGVWRGGTGCLMAKRAQLLRPWSTTFLCDTFTGVVKAGEQDTHYKGGEHADTSQGIVEKLVHSLDLQNVKIMTGIFPDDTGASIAGRQFALCHIDVDVYTSALHILEWVWPRMPIGGIVVYDDYGFQACSGITRLVNERAGIPGTLTLHNLNGHAVVIKTA